MPGEGGQPYKNTEGGGGERRGRDEEQIPDAFENRSDPVEIEQVCGDSPSEIKASELKEIEAFFNLIMTPSFMWKKKHNYYGWAKDNEDRLQGKNQGWVMEEKGGKVNIIHLMEKKGQRKMAKEQPQLLLEECPENIRESLQKVLDWIRSERDIPPTEEMYFAVMRTPPGAPAQSWHIDSLYRTNGFLLPVGTPPVPLTIFKNYTAPKRPSKGASGEAILEWMKETQTGMAAGEYQPSTQKRGQAQLFNPMVWHKGPAWPSSKRKGRVVLFSEWSVSDDPAVMFRRPKVGDDEDIESEVAVQVFGLEGYIKDLSEELEKEKKQKAKRPKRNRIPKKTPTAEANKTLAERK